VYYNKTENQINIKLLSMPQDFREAPNGQNRFSRSHLHIQILFLSPRALHMVFLQLRGVHLAGIQKSGPSQVLPSLLQDRVATAVCLCPSPIGRATGKAACQSHSLNHPQVVVLGT